MISRFFSSSRILPENSRFPVFLQTGKYENTTLDTATFLYSVRHFPVKQYHRVFIFTTMCNFVVNLRTHFPLSLCANIPNNSAYSLIVHADII